MKSEQSRTLVSINPGRDVQRVGTANFLGEDVQKIHDPVWAVIGNLGDSQCYLGVTAKVQAVQAALHRRIVEDDLAVRLIAPAFTLGVSDGQLNGTPQMRFSLIGRELVHDVADVHLAANGVAGLIAVVACDKPPVGTLAAVLENDTPAVILSDGSIHPGIDPETGQPIDLVSAFQMADQPDEVRTRYALHACPGQGSCGGMFTYNTMQTFIAVLGLEPLHMVSPASDDPRRIDQFPDEMVDCLLTMTARGIKPSDIVTPASLRNAVTVAIAMGGSTNVVLHSVEIARAAGIDLWADSMSQEDFNTLARRLPVLVNMRPFGAYSMVDVEAAGGLQVIVKELLEAGFLDGEVMTCTGETLAEQVARLAPPAPDHEVIYSVEKPFKDTGGLRLLRGNLAPDGGAILKVAGVEGGVHDGVFTGRARVFNGERDLIEALDQHPDDFQDNEMVVIRYAGPRGAPGMPELLDPTSRITALCRQRNITIALMTDARFSGGSVGLVIGHVAPEAFLGGPDRARGGRGHHCGRRQHGPHRLPAAGRRRGEGPPGRGVAGGGGGQRRRAPRRDTGDRPCPGAACGPRRSRPSWAGVWRRRRCPEDPVPRVLALRRRTPRDTCVPRGQTVVVSGGPETRYARSKDGVHVAFQVIGDGPLDLVIVGYGNVISVDMRDEEPHVRRFEQRLASFSRLIRFDPRGIGLSDAPPPGATLGIELVVDDILGVLDAVGSTGACLFAVGGSGLAALLTAAMHPGRISSLALLNCYARLPRDEDYPYGIPQRLLTSFIDSVLDVGAAGDPSMDDVQLLAPSLSGDPEFREWWARAGRRGASPAAARASLEMSFSGDVRSAVPLIDAPTLILHRDPSLFSVGHARYLADHLAHARLVVLPGGDHLPYGADSDTVIDEIEEFLTGVRGGAATDRVLTTVLFTDIVGSTERAARCRGPRLARAARFARRHDPKRTPAVPGARGEDHRGRPPGDVRRARPGHSLRPGHLRRGPPPRNRRAGGAAHR